MTEGRSKTLSVPLPVFLGFVILYYKAHAFEAYSLSVSMLHRFVLMPLSISFAADILNYIVT